jgi:hypothetical protein
VAFLILSQADTFLSSQIELLPSDYSEVLDIDPMSFSTNFVSNCKIQPRILS